MGRFTGILGLLAMLGLAYAFSTDRKAIRGKTVAWGLGLQLVFAIFVLKVDIGRQRIAEAGEIVKKLLSYAFAGSEFVFGDLGKQASHGGFNFAFQVLPTVIFIAAFFAILYHYGIMREEHSKNIGQPSRCGSVERKVAFVRAWRATI